MTAKTDVQTDPVAWHAITADEAMARVQTSPDGLQSGASQQRLEQHGPNRLKPPKRRSAFMRFVAQFRNVLIYVLVVAGLITAAIGNWTDSGVIFGVVIINAIIGFVQEGKAEHAMDAIRSMLSPHATVLRDGHRVSINAEEVVPGDVVILQPGDRVPADLRLFHARDLHIDEAALTGESLPVEKSTEPVHENAVVGDRCEGEVRAEEVRAAGATSRIPARS